MIGRGPEVRNGSSVTIYQVARAAGVSPSTVSNLLNGRPGRMLPATKQRVEEAIERLGYRPNRTARQLRTGRTQAIGLVVPSVANPFWGTFARHLEGSALAEDYHVLLCNSEREPERERRYLEQLWDDGIRGVVLCSSLPSLDHVKPLLEAGLTVVAFDRTAQAGDPETLVNISVDNVVGAHLVTQHLLGLGHRRLAYVSGSLRAVNRQERYRGYLSAIAEAGLDMAAANAELSTSDDRYGDRDAAELGRARTVELLNSPNPPTALVAMNDMCALGVCAGVRDTGRQVGEDVSVVGFDDILLAELCAPALTTVRQPLERMAAEAFQHLRTGIEGGAPVAGRSLLIRPELVVRASTAPPR
ncbi:LacI family transcriptional regulator [Allokutzneria sp. A3M-2-11 16]|uniref:LacI family DNA-binding transcriptional regulator n=1 Tax=Allokutzneria sp. A3M-2-11 16 TaxID=2962043 RepID=UPI0020B8E38F|nr:LacI family DNA-binding transcriptional regulator [Allokutzneria sp. A3M-2-11 16]MCP3801191.1 LacI family transcriptional regulator [Allokutzneria sp. A3M-2-11 16]